MVDGRHPPESAPRLDPLLEVLVVDDQPDELALLARELSGAGLRVRCASSGEQALLEAHARLPDVVLLDVRMSGIDGFVTCTRLRQHHGDLPVVFMTGLGETEHVVRGFEVGAVDYVTKPVCAPQVAVRLLAHARTARLMRATRHAIDAIDLPMLAIDDGRMLWCNDAARRLLAGFGEHIAQACAGPLPAALRPLSRLQAGVARVSVESGGRRLDATRIDEPSRSGACVVALVPDAAPRLTTREAEVLSWVARGKTNRDIAEILGMSPRTVNKHLEHVFEKLGVETRTAAAAAARRLRID